MFPSRELQRTRKKPQTPLPGIPIQIISNHQRLCSLSCLLRADQRNDATQLSTLRKLFLLDLVVDVLASGDVVADGQHAVLQRQQLGQSVVEEGCGEGNVGRRLSGVGEAHFKLARGLADGGGWLLLLLLLRLGSRSVSPLVKSLSVAIVQFNRQ
jgi:hypothetical protein